MGSGPSPSLDTLNSSALACAAFRRVGRVTRHISASFESQPTPRKEPRCRRPIRLTQPQGNTGTVIVARHPPPCSPAPAPLPGQAYEQSSRHFAAATRAASARLRYFEPDGSHHVRPPPGPGCLGLLSATLVGSCAGVACTANQRARRSHGAVSHPFHAHVSCLFTRPWRRGNSES